MTRRNGRLSPRTNDELEVIDLTPDRILPADRPKPPEKLKPALTPRMRQVLDAAGRVVAEKGCAPTSAMVAAELGESGPAGAHRVNQVIAKLRALGAWPHGDPKPGRPQGYSPAGRTITSAIVQGGNETEILARCAAAIDGLDPGGRRRVLRYLADRFGEEQRP